MKKKRLFIEQKLYRFIPMLFLMVVIFVFSQMPGDESSGISEKFLEPILNIVKGISRKTSVENFRDSLHWLIRKAAHFTEYGVFGVSIIYALYGRFHSNRKLIWISELIVFLYACSDEVHQYFIQGRYMAFLDVCIDSSGALLGIMIVMGLIKRFNKKEYK